MDPEFLAFLSRGGISVEIYETMNPSVKGGLFIEFNESKRIAVKKLLGLAS
jgi:hypothetical protein